MEGIVERSPKQRGSGAGHVFDVLREDIIALKLKPGAVLSRGELQDRFGLSSTPVRDALMRLQEEGLVDVFPQHATIVAPIDLDRARQGQFLRRAVELEIVSTLATAPEKPLIEQLRGNIRRQAVFAEAGDHGAFNNADLAFHRAMYAAAGVDALWQLVRRHAGHIDRLRRLHLPVEGKTQEILVAHTAIVDAIEAGKPAAAQAAMRDHLSRSIDFFGTLRQRYPEYFGS